MRWRSAVVAASVCVAGFGCSSSDPAPSKPSHAKPDAGSKPLPAHDASTDAVEVLIGTPSSSNGIDFVPLDPGGDIPLETFGQGGTHASLAIRCIGFGSQAYVDVSVEDPVAGTRVMTVPTVRPQLLACDPDDPQVCDDAPIHVMTGGLADPDKKDGLAVRVIAVVHTAEGLTGTGRQDGVLRKSF